MRVGIIALQHESNTFLPQPTTFKQFQNDLLLGQAIHDQLKDAHHEVGGFFAGLAKANLQAVPIFMARAIPSGTITAEACDQLLDLMFKAVSQAGPIDGLLVAPHGAAVSAKYRDLDGHWLGLLRQRLGRDCPMICTLDPHANISPAMIEACDATIAYRTNPHLDQRQRGREAAMLMARTLAGEVRPVQQYIPAGLAINIERQLTEASPCRKVYALADELLKQPGVLSNSIILGFPYADVEEMGSGCIVVTDQDRGLAVTLARTLADHLWTHREAFVGQLIGIEEAILQARRDPGPVCLLDMGDNVGGGSPGDGTLLAHAIHQARMPRGFVCLYDPEAMAAAQAVGPGRSLHLSMGGKMDTRHGPPLEAAVTVRSLHEGRFTEPEPRHGGRIRFDMGPTAIVETAHGLTVMLTSQRTPPSSLHQLISCGLDPEDYHLLVAKGVHAPVAAYQPICSRLIRVNTPGVTTADMASLHYRYRSRPLYPFDTDSG